MSVAGLPIYTPHIPHIYPPIWGIYGGIDCLSISRISYIPPGVYGYISGVLILSLLLISSPIFVFDMANRLDGELGGPRYIPGWDGRSREMVYG